MSQRLIDNRIARRRDRVWHYYHEGYLDSKISEILRCSPRTIRRDRLALGLIVSPPTCGKCKREIYTNGKCRVHYQQDQEKLLKSLREDQEIKTKLNDESLLREVYRTGSWRVAAACRNVSNPEIFFPYERTDIEGKALLAKSYCDMCLVVNDCLQEALDNHITDGIWGGMTAEEREKLLRSQKAS